MLALALVGVGVAFIGARSDHAHGPRHRPVVCKEPPTVYLTREAGKNAKLEKLLSERGIPCAELPCIAFQQLPGSNELPPLLAGGSLTWVVVTSPEAANVLAGAWESAGRPTLRVASVGVATAKALGSLGITSSFTPSTATGKSLAAELPYEGDRPSVLYPCSALAADTVAEALSERGFDVTRLETYTTVPAEWAPEQEALARSAAVVSFASPSAARVWYERVGPTAVAACIGETSAEQVRHRARLVRESAPDGRATAAGVGMAGACSLFLSK